MPVITKPTVLVSSTIYDFHDLRSALRYWLSELGYEVMLSEFNDFPKALDENSYHSCLNAIAKADYFILLLGSRTGGWFDQKNRVSITRMEYRAALDRFQKTGKPKLAVFVRQDLWDIREDRNALLQYLKEDHAQLRELTAEARDQLAKHPSRFVNDAETVFNFLHEVGQVEQMKQAAAGLAELPKGNWIHRFASFADIANALRIALGATTHVERRILAENLKQELLRNLCHLTQKLKEGELMPIAAWANSAAAKIVGDPTDESNLQVQDLTRLVIFRVAGAPVPNRLSFMFIEQAIRSGMFMAFDAASASYKPSRVHGLLLDLLSLISSLQRQASSSAQSVYAFADTFKPAGRPRDQVVAVRNLDIAMPCADAKALGRITDISIRLVQWLNGKQESLEAIAPWSPTIFPAETGRLEREQVRLEDIAKWIAGLK